MSKLGRGLAAAVVGCVVALTLALVQPGAPGLGEAHAASGQESIITNTGEECDPGCGATEICCCGGHALEDCL